MFPGDPRPSMAGIFDERKIVFIGDEGFGYVKCGEVDRLTLRFAVIPFVLAGNGMTISGFIQLVSGLALVGVRSIDEGSGWNFHYLRCFEGIGMK